MPVLPSVRSLTRPAGVAAERAVFLNINRVEATRAGGWDRHRHAEHEIIVADRGDYRGTLNGAPLALQPGEALVIQPGDWHEDLLSAGTCFHAVWFRLPGGLLAAGIQPSEQIARPGCGLVALTRQLEALVEAGATAARLDIALAGVIGALLDGLPAATLAPAFTRDLGFAARLHLHFARLPAGRTSAAALARTIGLSQRTLERRCRAELGCGPVQAHARWRLQRAGELLRTTDWPVRAVSETLGFANPFHFSRAFARLHGAPPAAWRGRGAQPGSSFQR